MALPVIVFAGEPPPRQQGHQDLGRGAHRAAIGYVAAQHAAVAHRGDLGAQRGLTPLRDGLRPQAVKLGKCNERGLNAPPVLPGSFGCPIGGPAIQCAMRAVTRFVRRSIAALEQPTLLCEENEDE